MYNGQRNHLSSTQRKEVANHCRHILSMAALVVAEKGTEQHNLIFSIFLAGVNSANDHDKNRAIGLIRAMEGTGISCNVTKSRELLETMCVEQRERIQFGGNASDIDWVSFAKERGIRLVNMGLWGLYILYDYHVRLFSILVHKKFWHWGGGFFSFDGLYDTLKTGAFD